ncbi:MAG: hypothetical protein AAF696_26865 [Bacteroidota bacterium]
MNRKKAARIGRFEFTSIFALIERLKEAANFFSPQLSFNTYLITFKSQSYYGMDYAELASVFEEHEGDVKSMTSSCNIGEGKSMSVAVRYPKKGGKADAQFMISSDSPFISQQIEDIFRGEYIPLQEDALWARAYVGELIGNLLLYKEQEAEKKVRERARIAAERAAAKLKEQENKAKIPAYSDVHRFNSKDGFSNIKPIRDKFSLHASLSADLIIEMLVRISEHLLNKTPFRIKVITSNGQPFSNVGFKGLKLFLEKRRKSVRTLMMDAATSSGEWVNIIINFEANHSCSVSVEVFARRGKMIQAMIRDFLERTAEVNLKTASMVHEMFHFDQENFSMDQVSKLISHISSKYLKKEAATAFLSTSEGETYPALTLRQLRSVYTQKKEEISFLLYGINQSDTGQTFSLMFQFESPVQKAYGSLSMMWGNHETHQVVRALVWEQLGLQTYRKRPLKNGEDILSPDTAIPVPKSGANKTISFEPVFKQREFNFEPLTALVFMPLEAYWSESLWLHLQDSLRELGYYTRKANSIYSENSLEDNWKEINESELIIADLTYKHPDVFYKVGIAHTLGKKVILITQHARDLPADFKNFPFVVYDNNIYGLQDLRNSLLSLVRNGN